MRIWLLAILLAMTVQSGICEDQKSSSSPEELRFAEQKKLRKRSAIQNYVRNSKFEVERQWHPEQGITSALQITKVRVTIDANGQAVACKVVSPSKSNLQDSYITQVIKQHLFQRLPFDVNSLDLFWTFMSDGSMYMVECTESDEANAYYGDILDGTIDHNGNMIMPNRMNRIIPPTLGI